MRQLGIWNCLLRSVWAVSLSFSMLVLNRIASAIGLRRLGPINFEWAQGYDPTLSQFFLLGSTFTLISWPFIFWGFKLAQRTEAERVRSENRAARVFGFFFIGCGCRCSYLACTQHSSRQAPVKQKTSGACSWIIVVSAASGGWWIFLLLKSQGRTLRLAVKSADQYGHLYRSFFFGGALSFLFSRSGSGGARFLTTCASCGEDVETEDSDGHFQMLYL